MKKVIATIYSSKMSSDFYKEWFQNQNWWFSATFEDDLYITNTYSYLLENNENLSDIEKIIIYDQLPRHIYRKESANHIIEFFLQKALKICQKNVANSNLQEWIFYMLPFRHTNDPLKIAKVMEEIWKRNDINDPLMKKFIKATFTRCPKYQDQFIKIFTNIKNKNSGICIDSNDPIFIQIKNKMSNIDNVILSFSGGVDSIVCSAILSNLNIKWCAVHINYMNRSSSIEEEEFVIKWCKMLGVNLYVRRITEINRNICMKYELRELYENYTRDVRYNSYKFISKNPIVILGHNEDDCIENILTNIAQQRKYDELSGMSSDSTQDNIRFIRPMLNIAKKDIYEFSKIHGIPHLPDSTPKWSQRGKIRTSVRPILEQWDNRTLKGLLQLNSHMKELHQCLDIVVNNMISNTQKINEDESILMLEEIPIILCWRKYIQTVFNITPSYRSLESFKYRYEHLKDNQNTTIPITKQLSIIIKNKKIIFKKYV